MVSFQGKYEILSPLSDGESQSFRALQISSGRSVLVHHLAAGRTPSQQPDLASLIFRFLRSASADKSRNFLDMGEDEGRIFVVTADVPECLDLRRWLYSVTEAQAGKEGDAQPAAGETPGLRSLELTSNFTTKALRQVSCSPVSEPVPPSPGPHAAPPAVPPPEESPGVLKPPPEIPAALPEVTDPGPTDFTGFWEKLSPASPAGYPASISTPPTSEGSGGPSEVPEVTAEGRSFLSDGDAPTAPLTNLRAQSADREPAPTAVARPAEAKGGAGQFADLVLPPPERLKPPLAPREAEVSKLSPQPPVPPAADGSKTKTPREFTGLLVEKDKTPPQAAALSSTPHVDDQQQAEVKLAEKIPRRQMPMGFEVVFQSSKPRSRPTLSGVPDQSGIMTAPTLITPRTGPEEAVPTPAAAGLPQVAPPAVSPVAKSIGGSPAMGFPPAPQEPRQAVGTRKEPSALPSPLLARQAFQESGKATGLVPAPPVTPVGRAPQAPPGGSASPGGATPPVSAPMPNPPTRAQPGEYTRMIENVKALASPLPPVGPPGVRPAGLRLAANPAVPAPAPSRASYLQGPAPDPPPYHEAPPQFRPSLYIAHDTPSHFARQKRKVWVPILILSSLFLMTVVLLLFFAFKH